MRKTQNRSKAQKNQIKEEDSALALGDVQMTQEAVVESPVQESKLSLEAKIDKLTEQLGFLEKKIDSLIEQSKRGQGGGGGFQRDERRFDRNRDFNKNRPNQNFRKPMQGQGGGYQKYPQRPFHPNYNNNNGGFQKNKNFQNHQRPSGGGSQPSFNDDNRGNS